MVGKRAGAASLEALGPSTARAKSQKQRVRGAKPTTPEAAVSSAPRARCPNAPRRWVWELRTGKTSQLACGRWSCPVCGVKKRAAAEVVFESGMVKARSRGERLRLITLTDGTGDMDLPALYTAWNRLRTKLRRRGVLNEYAAVVEATAGGRLHLHVIATGRYIRQRTLAREAEAAGFGRIAHIKELRKGRAFDRAARYMAKYLSKQEEGSERAAAVASAATTRMRPVRTSRGWGMTVREAERIVVERWIAARGGTPALPVQDATWVMVTAADASDRFRVWHGREELSPDELAALLHDIADEFGLAALGFRLATPERLAGWSFDAWASAVPPPEGRSGIRLARPPRRVDPRRHQLSLPV